ncbi:MAG: hypothetical protein Q8M16_21350 [Pirellulaceae bacterium]|nr:hypothetical protein [Pirellulaceae bacterium]
MSTEPVDVPSYIRDEPSYEKPARSKYFNGATYGQMTEDLQLTGKAQRTVYGYLRAVR